MVASTAQEMCILAAISENPSFLAMSADKKYLVAANEINNDGVGTIESFLIRGDSLEFINRSSSGGAHPCFVAVNEAGYVLPIEAIRGKMICSTKAFFLLTYAIRNKLNQENIKHSS